MRRADAAWERSGRSAAWLGSVLGVVLLLVGVLSGTVSVEAMLVAAWLENLSAGAATVVGLLRAPGGRLPLPAKLQVELRGLPLGTDHRGVPSIPAWCAAAFFAVHFGTFTLVHGVFLGFAVASATSSGAGAAGLSGTALSVVAVAAFLRALRRVEPQRAIAQAYAGLVPLHLAVLALFATTVDLGRPGPGRGAALVIVGLLIGTDLLRARVAGRPDPQPAAVEPPPPPAPPPAWPPPTGPARG